MEVFIVLASAALLRLVWRNLTLPVRPLVALGRILGRLLTLPRNIRHTRTVRAVPRAC